MEHVSYVRSVERDLVTIGLLGVYEAMAFIHIQSERTWTDTIPLFIVIFAIVVWILWPTIIEENGRGRWWLLGSALFFAQYLHDMMHHLTWIVLTGNLETGELWYPLYDLLGLPRITYPIPLFWLVDITIATLLYWKYASVVESGYYG